MALAVMRDVVSMALTGTRWTVAPATAVALTTRPLKAPGWRAGWLAVGASHRMDGVLTAIRKLADGRLCSGRQAGDSHCTGIAGATFAIACVFEMLFPTGSL